MSVTDLHPEDLLDREARGDLTPKERAHLDAHLAQCAACRLERAVRADFAAELDGEDAAGGALLVSKILAAPPPPPVAEEPPAPRVSSRPGRARRRAGAFVVIAAALTLASVAVAARGTGVL
ncbi:MAG: zf-HC2 domain-containing protein, partial [Myxococcales bacterium]|nr:zf-HC2 domain-containing protein [Myxococcales bacterium]